VRLVLSALAVLWSLAAPPARAASLEGVSLPDQTTEGGKTFVLNGIGLRTASIFNISVYVAGLYLEAPSHDAEAILRSPGGKLLELHFLRDLEAKDARHAWSEGFQHNCPTPCRLDENEVARFLEAVTPVVRGDVVRFHFAASGVSVTLNGRTLGAVRDPHFSRVILATFIGARPATQHLKDALLGITP